MTKLSNSWKTHKVEPHTLHYLCSRICSFPPSIPYYFIKKFSKKGDIIFDPWSGKGSVPFEALRLGRIGIGNDKSPEAFILTHAKVKPPSFNTFEKYVYSLKSQINHKKLPRHLTELDRKASIFFSKKTFEQILRLKQVLKNEHSTKAIFMKAIIMGLLHGRSINTFSLTCSHAYAMSPAYVKKYAKEHSLRRPSRDIIQCILNRSRILLNDPLPQIKGKAMQNDSTKINLKSKSVDMILTSPPYFAVQTYAWANWLRLWFLGYDHRDIRKKLAESNSTNSYASFMQKSIIELHRVLKNKGKCFIVVGDVNRITKGEITVLNTANFLKPICEDAGFLVKKIVRDTIPKEKKVNSYLSDEKGIKTERILYLTKSKK